MKIHYEKNKKSRIYGTVGRVLVGKICLKVDHPKFEGHDTRTPTKDEYQKSVGLKFRYCLGIL